MAIHKKIFLDLKGHSPTCRNRSNVSLAPEMHPHYNVAIHLLLKFKKPQTHFLLVIGVKCLVPAP